LGKESFMCPFEAWGGSCTPLLGVDNFVPIGLGSLYTPLPSIGGVVAIMLVSFPIIGLSWTTSTPVQNFFTSCDFYGTPIKEIDLELFLATF
jgi:hypothetical protein